MRFNHLRLASTLAAGLLLSGTLTGCFLSDRSDAELVGSDSASIMGAGGLEGFKTTVYPYVRQHCKDCHGAGQTPTFALTDVVRSYKTILEFVNFTNPADSTLVRKRKDAHCGPNCTGSSADLEALIARWRQAFHGNGRLPGENVPKGKIFTTKLTVPAPDPVNCPLPVGLSCFPYQWDTNGRMTRGRSQGVDCPSRCWYKLKYKVADMTPRTASLDHASIKTGAWFEIDFSYASYESANPDGSPNPASYVLRNPRLISRANPEAGGGAIYGFDIKTFLNGEYDPSIGGVFRKIDAVVPAAIFGEGCTVPVHPIQVEPYLIGANCVPAAAPLFSTALTASGILQRRMTGPRDEFSFSFEYLQPGITGPCNDRALWEENVYAPIRRYAVACLNCHREGGGITEAGKRFNMDENDPLNGANNSERLENICKKFLQRSNFEYIENSAIIQQPRVGLNGMPPQENFDYFAPLWTEWIQSEKDLRD